MPDQPLLGGASEAIPCPCDYGIAAQHPLELMPSYKIRNCACTPSKIHLRMNTRYVVITPVRNEESYLPLTIESVTRQSIFPLEWVIVNDGSTDRTGRIIDEYAHQFSWIRTVHRPDRGFRSNGGGVMEAFNAGYAALSCRAWDFIVKLDGDLEFETDYFKKCFQRFEKEPQLGVGGGVFTMLCSTAPNSSSRVGHRFMFEAQPRFIDEPAGKTSVASGQLQGGTR